MGAASTNPKVSHHDPKVKKNSSKNSDRQYMAAVNRGDMETAQRMVDEAAKKAGYTTKGYHGSPADFTVVDGDLWLTRDRLVAQYYYGRNPNARNRSKAKGSTPNDAYGVYSLYYRLGNNLCIYADGSSWGELPVTEDEYPGVYADEETGDITTNAMAEWAKKNGYDSITFVDVYDGGNSPTTVDVVFNPNRDAKSSNPVTYDNAGNVIPLSQRFNPKNDDIRYSERDFTYKELTAKNDLQGNLIKASRTVKMKSDGSIDKAWLVGEALRQCEIIQTKSPTPTYYVNIPDIGKNVQTTGRGIEHGLIKFQPKGGKTVPQRSLINARAALDLPQILRNSIEVNRSERGDNAEVEFSHVLIGVTAMEAPNGKIEYYAVRSVVEARRNQGAILTEANVIGKLHAINAKNRET